MSMCKYNDTKEIVFKRNKYDKPQMLVPVVDETGTEDILYVGVFRDRCIQSGWDEYLQGDFSSSPCFNLRQLASLSEQDARAIIGMAITCALYNLDNAYSILISPITIKFIDQVYEYLIPHLVEFDPDKRLSDQHPTIKYHEFDPDKRLEDQDFDHIERYDPDKPVLRKHIM